MSTPFRACHGDRTVLTGSSWWAENNTENESTLLPALQLQLLQGLTPKLPPNPNAREALRVIAKLVGFLGRKSDGEPGWRTLYAGYQRLLALEQGALLALHLHLTQKTFRE